MQKNKSNKTVGLFVLAGFLCFAYIIYYYINKQFNINENSLIVMHFDESIKGLNVGSPVVLRGVEIGKVAKIGLVADMANASFDTSVYVKFDTKKILPNVESDDANIYSEDYTLFENLIKKGLRAKLASSNYLTGQLMIELVIDPKQPAILKEHGKCWEIPTEYSQLAMLSKDLKELPLKETLSRFSEVMKTIEEKLPQLLNNMDKITNKLDKTVEIKSIETTKTLHNLDSTLEQISRASISIKNLSDYLEQHPEAVIYGKEK